MVFNELKIILLDAGHKRFTVVKSQHLITIFTRVIPSNDTRFKILKDINMCMCVRYKNLPWYRNIFKKIQMRTTN